MEDWRGEELLQAVREQLGHNILEAGEFLAEDMRKRLSTPYPPASAPGESPHMRTGGLRSRVTSIMNREKLESTTGASGKVAYWLETSTKKMKARPWAMPSLMNNLAKIKAICIRGIGREV